MDLVFCEDGLLYALDSFLAKFNTDGVKIRLFQNNHTPIEADDISDYTEATFSGYAAQTVGAWSAATIVSNVAVALSVATFTFTNSTGAVGNNIYGYYLTNSGGTVLIYAQKGNTTPIDMNTAGQSLQVVPRVTLDNP